MVVFDKDGLIHAGRTNLAPIQMQFATTRPLNNLDEAMEGADVFLGLSAANVLPAGLLLRMATDPIVFALANPDPEIELRAGHGHPRRPYHGHRPPDHPNQVNNVLGSPYIFRGALDVRATEINEAMKLAAVHALAQLSKEPVPDMVNKAYGDNTLAFGRTYLIPKPLDPRLITTISPAVARAAMESGVARLPIEDWAGLRTPAAPTVAQQQKLMNRTHERRQGQPQARGVCRSRQLQSTQSVPRFCATRASRGPFCWGRRGENQLLPAPTASTWKAAKSSTS
ncbi:MAG: malic enzyme-like NAD(P)-binding protein [Hymenobacter sp.]